MYLWSIDQIAFSLYQDDALSDTGNVSSTVDLGEQRMGKSQSERGYEIR